ncbi:hypothetical protein [Halalkalibacter alkaliphilus]|uniref:Uncharacterized protein n=1 Tax=Halalkalibacter alkaliphilus TaxID=2917993 RepID=A0A9X2CS84_9BACI|nr:hypothetical protein [Halalkalibacter alkaliphilus]MCL7747334.1 hypothetical protein [Halalkalibacter alkaliphilus]
MVHWWMVVYDAVSCDFFNDSYLTDSTLTEEQVIQEYEENKKGYKVIHTGIGNTRPKTYRALEYVGISLR